MLRVLRVAGAVSGFLLGGGENLPGGGGKNLAAPPSPQRFFCFPTHYINNLRPLFFTFLFYFFFYL